MWLAGDIGGTKTLLGLVGGEEARLTHIEWNIGAAEISARLGAPCVRILNDLEAIALGAAVHGPERGRRTAARGRP